MKVKSLNGFHLIILDEKEMQHLRFVLTEVEVGGNLNKEERKVIIKLLKKLK